MSFVQAIKDYGTMTGCFALAASISYAAYTVGSRFDRIEGLAQTANQTVDNVKSTVTDISAVQVTLRKDFADMKAALPDFGNTAGEAGANAVNTMEGLLNCPADKPDCDESKGLRGAVKRQFENWRP